MHEIDETTLESAKSSLHFNIAEAEGTVAGAAQESFFDQALKNAPKNRGKLLLKAVQQVTLDDVKVSLKHISCRCSMRDECCCQW